MRINVLKLYVLSVCVAVSSFTMRAEESDMNGFIDHLMKKMTLEEKVGQLNLLPGKDVTTGSAVKSSFSQLIEKGQLGAVLNVSRLDKIKQLQEIAVNKGRLGIPLIFGLDVIHGNVTVLPVPLAQSCTWNLDLIERGAQVAAKEATAQGINWNYSPMVDVSVDRKSVV